MAFLRYAKANVVTPHLSFQTWNKVRVASGNSTSIHADLLKSAQEVLGEPCTPDRFLLTHSTIVCSVDAVPVPGVKTGSVTEGNTQINRKYPDYRITSETDKFINNNLDAWSRGVIKKSYKTFIGAHNFVEHIQVEELSKGRIIDAVIRDIGESLYVDILVATDKKNKELVQQILAGEMNAMSMGCSVDFTVCTKCGHVAADETEMCPHVKYEKGNWFFDEKGERHRVAELCGHESVGGTGGVTFIEASWVAVPAFKGAVVRNTFNIPSQEMNADAILNEPPTAWTISKSASSRFAGPFDEMDSGDEEGGGEEEKAPEAGASSMLDEIEGVVREAVVDRIKKKLQKEIREELAQSALNPEPPISKSTVGENDTIIKEGNLAKSATLYMTALQTAVDISPTRKIALYNIRLVNEKFGVDIPDRVYKMAARADAPLNLKDLKPFMSKKASTGMSISEADANKLVRLTCMLAHKK